MQKESIVVKKSCHSRVLLSGIYNACRCPKKGKVLLNNCVEDPRLRLSGMTSYVITARGFTLIELLVVVLIIGILAAVAVPQYQKAVEKSHITPYIAHIENIVKAEQVYFLENGRYTPNLTELDIDVTKICKTNGGTCKNELYDCPINLAFNLTAQVDNGVCKFTDTPPSIFLRYCPNSTEKCDSRNQNYALAMRVSVENGALLSSGGMYGQLVRDILSRN